MENSLVDPYRLPLAGAAQLRVQQQLYVNLALNVLKRPLPPNFQKPCWVKNLLYTISLAKTIPPHCTLKLLMLYYVVTSVAGSGPKKPDPYPRIRILYIKKLDQDP